MTGQPNLVARGLDACRIGGTPVKSMAGDSMAKHGVPDSQGGLGIIWVLRAIQMRKCHIKDSEEQTVHVQERRCTYLQKL
jgi:hypothetical protein